MPGTVISRAFVQKELQAFKQHDRQGQKETPTNSCRVWGFKTLHTIYSTYATAARPLPQPFTQDRHPQATYETPPFHNPTSHSSRSQGGPSARLVRPRNTFRARKALDCDLLLKVANLLGVAGLPGEDGGGGGHGQGDAGEEARIGHHKHAHPQDGGSQQRTPAACTQGRRGVIEGR